VSVPVEIGRARSSAATARRRRPRPDLARLALGILTGLLYLYMFLPIFVIVLLSFSTNEMATLPIRGFTLQWYVTAFANDHIRQGLKNSLGLGVLTVVASSVLGLLGAIAIARFSFRGKDAFAWLVLLPMITPRLILGIMLLGYFAWLKASLSLGTVLLGHVLLTVPFTTLVIAARLQDLDPALDEAAWDLGAGWFTRLRLITLPLLLPAILAAALLAFTVSFDDIVIAFFTIGTDVTLPVVLWNLVTFGFSQTVNAVGTTVMVVTTALVVAAQLLLKREGRAAAIHASRSEVERVTANERRY
jgi:spermidine/putrescine transport system permease protein